MSDGTPTDPSAPGPSGPGPAPAPTTVVGYPGHPAAGGSGYAGPGIATLRGQLRTVRSLLVACLVILVLVAVGLGALLVTSQAQLADLRDQVSALSAAPASAAAAPESVPSPAAAAPKASAVPQLATAKDLPGQTVRPKGVDATGAVLIGDPNAGNVVEVYVDYQCPFCQRYEQQVGNALAQKALQPGSDLLVKQYDLAFLGETSPTLDPPGASARAASAAACVLHNDGAAAFVEFTRTLFETADPSEPAGQFPTDQLVSLASSAGASTAAQGCIADGTYVPFVAATTAAGFERGVKGTPTVVINGETIANPFTDARLTELATSTSS